MLAQQREPRDQASPALARQIGEDAARACRFEEQLRRLGRRRGRGARLVQHDRAESHALAPLDPLALRVPPELVLELDARAEIVEQPARLDAGSQPYRDLRP